METIIPTPNKFSGSFLGVHRHLGEGTGIFKVHRWWQGACQPWAHGPQILPLPPLLSVSRGRLDVNLMSLAPCGCCWQLVSTARRRWRSSEDWRKERPGSFSPSRSALGRILPAAALGGGWGDPRQPGPVGVRFPSGDLASYPVTPLPPSVRPACTW